MVEYSDGEVVMKGFLAYEKDVKIKQPDRKSWEELKKFLSDIFQKR